MGFSFRCLILAGIPVLAVLLGGATSPLAQGLIVSLMGVAVLFLPVKQRIHFVPLILVAFILLWCALPFLPAGWVAPELWRKTVEEILGTPLSPSYSAQPWMTLEGWGLLAAVLVWGLWLSAQSLDERHRALLLRFYLLGILMVGVLALASHISGLRPPFWTGAFPGPFPNRNQSANVLALAGVASVCLGLRQLYHSKKNGWIWLGLAAFQVGFLALLGSRAGLLLFFLGVGIWLFWEVVQAKKKSRAVAGLACGMMLLAFVFLFGGESLDRILHTVRQDPGSFHETRLDLQRDAIEMWMDQPVLGLGLGNFDGVFGMYRDHYKTISRPIHPESDWVWWLCEAGIPGFLGLLILMGWFLRRGWPEGEEKDRRLRRMALVVLSVFMIHGFVDVPGHRLGSVLAALFFLPLALPSSGRGAGEPGRLEKWSVALGGLCVLMFGAVLTGVAWGALDWPGSAQVERLRRQALVEDAAGRHANALETARQGRALAGLDWRFHLQEGSSLLALNMDWPRAARAFHLVRMLEPDSPYVCLEMGVYWLGRDKNRVLTAWKEALRRRNFQRPGFYQQMYSLAERDPETRKVLGQLAVPYPELDLFVLDFIPGDQVEGHLTRILEKDPGAYGLSEQELTPFFQSWRRQMGDSRFLSMLVARPAWLKYGWWAAAEAHAELKQWAKALALADTYLVPPTLPVFSFDESGAREMLRNHPDDLPAGLYLFEQARKERNHTVARKRLDLLLGLPEGPAYLQYLNFLLYRLEGNDEGAWKALAGYRATAAAR